MYRYGIVFSGTFLLQTIMRLMFLQLCESFSFSKAKAFKDTTYRNWSI